MEAVFLIIIFFIGAFAFSIVNVLVLRMPSRLCKERITVAYPISALLGGCSAVSSVHLFWQACGMREGLQTALVFTLLAILSVISVIDIGILKIPNELVMSVFICGIAAAVLFPEPGVLNRISGAFAAGLPMAGLTLFIPGTFGGGDIKLMAAAGLFLGLSGILDSFLVALLAAGGYCLYLLLSGKKDRKGQFAFGPFLCIGIAAGVFLG